MDIKILTQFVIFLLLSSTVITIAETKQNEDTETYDYIIITNNYLKKSVQDLKEWRENQGFKVKIVTGMRNADEIRDFLKSKYLEWGIEYLLIVGSYRTIPLKKCYIDKEQNERAEYIPTDHYYAELTHNWDIDNDGYFGEFKDDIKNNTDLLPEISVGRIPFDRPKNVKDFCNKLINYEKDNGDWKRKALFLAGMQSYIPEYIDGTEFAEKLVNEILISYGFNCTKLYEAGGLKPTNYSYDLPLNHINTLIKLREGFGFVSIMGKGMARFARRYVWVRDNGNGIPDENEIKLWYRFIFLHSFDKVFLKTDKPSVVYSFTCYTANPRSMNLCSSLLDSIAVVFIGPTIGNRGGWQLKYNFTKYFSSTNMRLGDAFFNAKTEYINSDGGLDKLLYFFNDNSTRWTTLVTNFYGDPATLKFLPPIT
jgi:hypothetical protein